LFLTPDTCIRQRTFVIIEMDIALRCHHEERMPPTESFDGLINQLRAGDDDAAARVFNRFARRILGLARQQLHAALRSKVDPEDVLQSVFRSFFHRQRAGRFSIESWDSLWGILMVMTLRKCRRRIAYYRARRRDAQREKPWDENKETDGDPALFAREPTPSEAAILIDIVGRLMAGLPEEDRAVLTLHLQGCTIAEIKAQTGRAMRTIRRILERIRRQLRGIREKESARDDAS
jgi:RNA polymerase sigma-70 factor (ECF subfamily)